MFHLGESSLNIETVTQIFPDGNFSEDDTFLVRLHCTYLSGMTDIMDSLPTGLHMYLPKVDTSPLNAISANQLVPVIQKNFQLNSSKPFSHIPAKPLYIFPWSTFFFLPL
jgi:hypothetical protein